MIIDFHTHYYPEKIAARAIALPGDKLQPATDGTRKGLEQSMRRAGIDLSVLLALAGKVENSASVNRWAVEENHGCVKSLGSVHPYDPDFAATLDFVADNGLPGVKVHPEYQQFSFDDERTFPVWERCAELGLFVITHAGYDIMFSPPWRGAPEILGRFADRFPKLKIVLAHLGGLRLWDEVGKYLVGKKLYLDLSMAVREEIDATRLTRIIRRHGAERIIFGSDSPWYDAARQLEFINSLPLSGTEREMILCGNAAGLLKL